MLLSLLISVDAFAIDAPAFSLPASQHGEAIKQPVSLEDFRNKVVLLDFWASWCTPCRFSFPWMNQLQQRYADEDFEIIAINTDKDRARAETFLKQVPAEFIIAYDASGEVSERYHLNAMPTTYLIDRQGQLSSIHQGYKATDNAVIESTIKQLLLQE